MPIKSVKMKISKNKKMPFFLMSQGSFNQKIRFLCQKMCSVARLRTDRHTDTLSAPFQGFRSFSFNLSSRIGPIYNSFECFFEEKKIRDENSIQSVYLFHFVVTFTAGLVKKVLSLARNIQGIP